MIMNENQFNFYMYNIFVNLLDYNYTNVMACGLFFGVSLIIQHTCYFTGITQYLNALKSVASDETFLLSDTVLLNS
jgi:hypothetical protein